MQRPRFQEAWVTALVAAQQQVVRVLDDRAKFVQTEGGVVSVDLRPVLDALTQELPLVPNLGQKLPKNAGVITLFKADELKTAQTATRGLRFVAAWIWVLALVFWIAAVYLARDRFTGHAVALVAEHPHGCGPGAEVRRPQHLLQRLHVDHVVVLPQPQRFEPMMLGWSGLRSVNWL